ncbi:DUF2975 domain-containing protein [Martelella sp. AD-3]|uniref:DUF2975 domain-containing protein n=1 Tax=Martelella sp. AD-3 TaxID=686597 RepID=UPI00046649FE|nr:DUF2975 domain-containing protein [Martelella sp. AD-3]AMM85619.1 hypothetical protein AZF01_15690 [Martelella sp. AD-3]
MNSNNAIALSRLCGQMKLLTRIIQAGLAAGLAYAAWTAFVRPDRVSTWLADALDIAVAVTLTPATGLALFTLFALLAGVFFYGLQTVWSLFDRLQHDSPFSHEVAALLRRAGLIALAGAVAGLVLHPVATLLATIANPPGSRALAIGLGSDQLMLFLLAGLLFVMGHVMVLATAINEDYQRFV